jgi:hypothetical protein
MSKASDPNGPNIPEREFENPFSRGTFLHEIYGKVVSENRDLICVVSDMRGRRGTGKSVTSIRLADEMDRTDQGLTYPKCTMSAQELANAYSKQPKGSGLVLDEAEVSAGNRSAMTKTNKALRKILSMARVKEKYLVVNVPIKGYVDKDILKLADVWIAMERRGRGLVHHLKWEPYTETLHTEKKQRLEIADIPKDTHLREVYNKLSSDKNQHIDGDKGDGFMPISEHEEELQKQRQQVRKETRNEVIKDVYKGLSGLSDDDYTRMKRADGVSQSMLGDALGLTQQQVGNIVRGD